VLNQLPAVGSQAAESHRKVA